MNMHSAFSCGLRLRPSLGRTVLLGVLGFAGLGISGTHTALDQPFPCISRPCEQRQLGFSVRGVILETLVKAGDDVKPGQMLVRLEDRVQRQNVELGRANVENTTPVQQAESTLHHREEQLKFVEQSKSASAVNASEERDARYNLEQAKIDLEAAKQRARTDAIILAREEAQLAEMQMLAPVAGTVMEIHKKSGESVEEGANVITLLSIDPLWVEVSIPTRLAAQVSVGQGATVEWEEIDNEAPMKGKVIFKAPAAFGSRQIQIRVEVPNTSKIPSGLHGVLRFEGIEGVPAGK
jgi:membrane fusion protein (multidrug efflux system)